MAPLRRAAATLPVLFAVALFLPAAGCAAADTIETAVSSVSYPYDVACDGTSIYVASTGKRQVLRIVTGTAAVFAGASAKTDAVP